MIIADPYEKNKMNPTTMRIVEKNSGVFLIENFLSVAMCQHYIGVGEEMGYSPSEVNFAGERQLSWPVDDNYLGRFVT